ncbi:MAG: hypothetical protein Q9178_004711 [Gyalolechia marmorata]
MYPPCSLFLPLLLLSPAAVLGDFVGPSYPAPKDLASDESQVLAAWLNVTSTLDTYMQDPNTQLIGTSGLKNITFSLGMFSIHDPSAAESMQYHHASAEVTNSTTGVVSVDGNSIYRVASITKLMTAFVGELNLEARLWDSPITDFVPSLAEYAQNTPGEDDPVNTIQWEKVTLFALCSHMAGTPSNVQPFDPSLALSLAADPITDFGLPPLNVTDPIAFPPCMTTTDLGACTGNDYAKGAQTRPPTFLPWTSPQYTNFGFILLGLAFANITGKSMHDLYRDGIFTPLNMTSSSSLLPPDNSTWKNYVIPGDISNGALDPEIFSDLTVPSGGVFSTTNDLAKWGTALLNSTLLPPEQTRKWMKPVTHTGNLQYAIGRPWEIYRYVHSPSGIITDIYTKGGDSGAYSSYIAFFPDFDAGFTLLTASSLPQRTAGAALLADIISETMLPALLAQSEAEAAQNFVGTYTSTDPTLNTTLTVSLNETEGAKPGLVLTTFISNGTNILATRVLGDDGPFRLLPSVSDEASNQIAFRTSPRLEVRTPGLFSGLLNVAADWLIADTQTYGGLPLGLFVFETAEDGKAEAVRAVGWRVKLQRQV